MGKTRHIALHVTACLVDTYDAGTPKDPDDVIPGDAVYHLKSHPCPPCALVDPGSSERVEEQSPKFHEDCFRSSLKIFEDMLKDATEDVKKQAVKKWKLV